METKEALEALVKAKGDQSAAMLRDNLRYIELLARTDPEQWVEKDKLFIRGVLYAMTAYLLEGRL